MRTPLTPEQKERMIAGQKAARERRAAAKAEAEAALLANPVEALDEAPSDNDARRKRLLEGIDPEIAKLIGDDELEEIERQEQKKAADERKRKAIQLVRASAEQLARVENDLIDASVLRSDSEKKRMAEPVTFKIHLPSDGAGHMGQNGFRVNGFLYQNGMTYTRPRAIAESLQYNHYRAWLSELEFRTLDQHKPGNSARELLGAMIPRFYVEPPTL